jgi:class 3 adenylate cyclase
MLERIAAFVTSAALAKPPDRVLATVLCARIDRDGRDDVEANDFETHVRQEIAWFRGRGLAFTPDGFFAAFDGPARAISCARALVAGCPRFGRNGSFGLHTGECDLTPEGRVAGAAFERARAVCGIAAAGEVLVSRTVTDLVAGSGVAFVDRGAHPLQAGDETWRLFAVTNGGADSVESIARGLASP